MSRRLRKWSNGTKVATSRRVSSVSDARGTRWPNDPRRLVSAACLSVMLITGCTEEPRCVPGVSQACACVGGVVGAQSCLQDGSGFAPCVCTPSSSSIPALGADIQPVRDNATPRFVPLQRPWSRLFLQASCGAEDRYNMQVVPQLVWNPPGGPDITLTSEDVVVSAAAEHEPMWANERAVRLFGNWRGTNRRRVLVSRPIVGASCGEAMPLVVYAGVREDGFLLVSLETLPWSLPGDSQDMPGESKRALLRWDVEAQEIRAVDSWEGPTREAPAHLRIHAPR